jgi:hypothetical protein
VKVRYLGFFGATLRSRLTALQKSLLPHTQPPTEQTDQPATTQAPPWQDNMLCPKCGLIMLFQRILCPPLCRSP